MACIRNQKQNVLADCCRDREYIQNKPQKCKVTDYIISRYERKTRNVSKVHRYPRLAPYVNNWPISNLVTFTNIFITNVQQTTIGRNR